MNPFASGFATFFDTGLKKSAKVGCTFSFVRSSLSPSPGPKAAWADIPHNGVAMQSAIDSWLSANSSHRCAGVIHGHVHWDYSAKGKGTFTVIDHNTKNQISRTGTYGNFYEHGQCFCNYMPSFGQSDSTPTSSYRDVPVDAIFRGRKASTASQGLWTAVIVDTDNEMVNLIRFGAGEDRSYGYGATVYHTINNSLTHVTSSNSRVSIEDGESYTTTLWLVFVKKTYFIILPIVFVKEILEIP